MPSKDTLACARVEHYADDYGVTFALKIAENVDAPIYYMPMRINPLLIADEKFMARVGHIVAVAIADYYKEHPPQTTPQDNHQET